MSNKFQYNRWQRRICALSVQLYSDVTSVNLVFVSDKIIKNSDNFKIKCLSYSKKFNFMCSLVSVFLLFYLIYENMSTNVRQFRFLVIFDTCDVMYNWFISLLYLIIYNLGNLYSAFSQKLYIDPDCRVKLQQFSRMGHDCTFLQPLTCTFQFCTRLKSQFFTSFRQNSHWFTVVQQFLIEQFFIWMDCSYQDRWMNR